ncbi:MAG: hypothetical protein AAF420_10110, partial [Pseudomonadota bacterium]
MENNVYAAPESQLREIPSDPSSDDTQLGGSVEAAVAGEIDISMMETLGEAWDKMKGFKLTCLLAFALYIVVAILSSYVAIPFAFVLNAAGIDPEVGAGIAVIIQLLASLATMSMFMGIHILGIRHFAGCSISAGMVLRYFHKIIPL